MATQETIRNFSNREIKECIRRISNPMDKDSPTLKFCTVDSVDMAAKTITCTTEDTSSTQFVNVLLNTEENDSFTLFPSVGSTVLILITTAIKCVLQVAELDSIFCDIGKYHFEITTSGAVIKNDTLEFHLKDKLKIGDFKTHLDAFVGAIAAITVPTPAGPSGIPNNIADIEQFKTNYSQYLE